MKNLLYSFLLLFSITSCKDKIDNSATDNVIPNTASVKKGEQIFNDNNCVACHKINQKVVGPSLQEMAKIYKENKASLVTFLKEEAEPIVDPSQYETMKINLQITKNMTNEELQSLELYILNH